MINIEGFDLVISKQLIIHEAENDLYNQITNPIIVITQSQKSATS